MTFNKLMKTMDNWSEFATDMLANQYRGSSTKIPNYHNRRAADSVQRAGQKAEGKREKSTRAKGIRARLGA